MRKIFLILLCVVFLPIQQCRLLQGKPSMGKNLKYRFEYTLQGEAQGVFLFIFRYRFFFCATASVLLDAAKIDEKTLQFHFDDIDKTGYLLQTWGFTGRTLVMGTADYDPKKARQVKDKDLTIFKEKAPDFSRFIKQRKGSAFRILSRGNDVMTFKREHGGIHKDCSIGMKLQRLNYDKKYHFYFRIYPLLIEMVKLYNHSFLPGSGEKISSLKPGMEWQSPELDFSENINGIGAQTTYLVAKHITFKQQGPFKLVYRILPGTPGKLVIRGEAKPWVKIWDGFKIVQMTRTIEFRLSDGVVLGDKFRVEIFKKKGKCGSAQCSLTLVR